MRSLISRARRRSRSPCSSAWGDDADVACLRTLRPVLHLVLHLRALSQALEALAADRAVVDEDVLATVVLLDKAVTLVVVEPLHRSGCHIYTSPRLRHERAAGGAKPKPVLALTRVVTDTVPAADGREWNRAGSRQFGMDAPSCARRPPAGRAQTRRL